MRPALLIAIFVLAGCSTPAPAPESAAATAVAPAQEPAAAAAAADSATSDTEAPATKGGKFAFKPPPGYKVKIDDWDIVYCRKMPVLGSRFPKEVCMTEPELKEYMATAESIKRDKHQVSGVCSQAAGCANP